MTCTWGYVMTKRIISAMLLITILFSIGVCAENAPETVDESQIAKIVIEVSEPDEDDIITTKFSVYNTTYKGILAYLSFNKDVVVPVDYETKEPTTDFEKFYRNPTVAKDLETGEDIPNWSSEKGSRVDMEKGELFLASLVNINDVSIPNSLITANKQILVDESGVVIFEFCFKKITDGVMELKSVNMPGLANGIMLVNSSGSLSYVLEYEFSVDLGENVVLYSSPAVKERVSRGNYQSEEEKGEIIDGRALLTIFLQIGNYATVSSRDLKWIDKENKNVSPYIKNDRTMVPLRFIAEELNAKVSYDDETKVVAIKNMNTELTLTVGEKTYYNDGLKREMEVVSEVIDGRTFVPVRFISEALNRSVTWLEKEQMVIITQKDYPWNEDSEIEKTLFSNAQLLMSPMMRDFAY